MNVRTILFSLFFLLINLSILHAQTNAPTVSVRILDKKIKANQTTQALITVTDPRPGAILKITGIQTRGKIIFKDIVLKIPEDYDRNMGPYEEERSITALPTAELPEGRWKYAVVAEYIDTSSMVEDCTPPEARISILRLGDLTYELIGHTNKRDVTWNWEIDEHQNLTEKVNRVTFDAPGRYKLCLTISNACGSDTICQELKAELSPPLMLHLESPEKGCGYNVSCNDKSDGQASVKITGGQPPYKIHWTTGDTTANIDGLGPGIYSVKVTDQFLKVAVSSIEVEAPPKIESIVKVKEFPGGHHVSCNGASNGELQVELSGGSVCGDIELSWKGPNNFTSDKRQLSSLLAGDYNLTLVDDAGCQVSHDVVLSEPDPINLELLAPEFACGYNFVRNEASNGFVAAIASGGSPPYQYHWNNGQTGEVAFDLSPGKYLLALKDTNDCALKDSIILTSPPLLTLETFVELDSSSGTVVGRIEASPGGGCPPYKIAWYGPDGFQDSTLVIENLNPGQYIAHLSDTNRYTTIDTVILGPLPDPPPEKFCNVYQYNSLMYMISSSDEDEIWLEQKEKWVERTGTMVSDEVFGLGDEYVIKLKEANIASDLHDEPKKIASFDSKNQSDCKPCNSKCEEVKPDFHTGTKYGKYDRDSEGCEDARVLNHTGNLYVARLDVNGRKLETTRDPFPKYTCLLKKRSGILVKNLGEDDEVFVGEPVIIVMFGGEKTMTSNPPQADQGAQNISLYGAVDNGSNAWIFRTKDDGFNPNRFTKRWYIESNGKDRLDGKDNSEVIIHAFPPGRYNVIVEYVDKQTSQVVAKAELHSITVEEKHTLNTFLVPRPIPEAERKGAEFEIKGKCTDKLRLDAAVFAYAKSANVERPRARVSLDGYPQNEYWGGVNDELDLVQVLSLEHNRPATLFLQGYNYRSRSITDALELRTEGQALVEQCTSDKEGHLFQFTPVRWEWQHADEEPFYIVEVDLDWAGIADHLEVKPGRIIQKDADELGMIKLDLLPEMPTRGKVRLRIVKGESRIRLWPGRNKNVYEGRVDMPVLGPRRGGHIISERIWEMKDLPSELWLEGISDGEFELVLELVEGLGTDVKIICGDQVRGKVIDADLDWFGMEDSREIAPGQMLFKNYDDDDQDRWLDYGNYDYMSGEEGAYIQDDELIQLAMSVSQNLPPNSKVTLQAVSGVESIRIWPSNHKNNNFEEVNPLIGFGFKGNPLRNIIEWKASEMPSALWVEGIDPGRFELELTLTVPQGNENQLVLTDKVLGNVISIGFNNPVNPNIGVKNDCDDFMLRDGKTLDLYYHILPEDQVPSGIELLIKNARGDILRVIDLPDKTGDNQKYSWNGKGDDGKFYDENYLRFEIRGKLNELEVKNCTEDHQITDLVYRHRPIMYMHEDEICNPVDVSFMLDRADLYRTFGPKYPDTRVLVKKGPISLEDLKEHNPDVNDETPDYWLEFQNTDDRTSPGEGPLRVYHKSFVIGRHIFVQYWYFFATSFITFTTLTDGDMFWHEGDWEMVQVAVHASRGLPPQAATASQHYYGQTLRWDRPIGPTSFGQNQTHLQTEGMQPKIWFSAKSHAIYFREGRFKTEPGPQANPQFQYEHPDITRLLGSEKKRNFSGIDFTGSKRINPEGEHLQSLELSPIINNWNGRWGITSDFLRGAGPPSPAYRGPAEEKGGIIIQGDPMGFHNAFLKRGQEEIRIIKVE